MYCIYRYGLHSFRKKKPVGGVALFPGGADLFGQSSGLDKPVEPASPVEAPIKSPKVQPKPTKKKGSSVTSGGLFDEGGGTDEDDIFSFSPSTKKR